MKENDLVSALELDTVVMEDTPQEGGTTLVTITVVTITLITIGLA